MSPQQFFDMGATSLRMWTRPFQPEDEQEADREGARMAYRAGYDPREMARLFLEIQEREAAQHVPLPQFLQSHPAPGDRHKAIMESTTSLCVRTRSRGPTWARRTSAVESPAADRNSRSESL